MAESGTKATLNAEAIAADRERRERAGIEGATAGQKNYSRTAVLTDRQKAEIQEGAVDSRTRRARERYLEERKSKIQEAQAKAWRAERDKILATREVGYEFGRAVEYYTIDGERVTVEGKLDSERATYRAKSKVYEAERKKVVAEFEKKEEERKKQILKDAEKKKPSSQESMARAEAITQVDKKAEGIFKKAESLKDTPDSELKKKLDDIAANRADAVGVEATKILDAARQAGNTKMTPEEAQKIAENAVDEQADAIAAVLKSRERVVFREQSYLVSILDHLSKKRMKELPGFKHIVSLYATDPASVTSLLYAFNGMELLNKLTPAQIALMVPYITVSMLEYAGSVTEIPVPLQGLWLREDVFSRDPGSRGRNIGLKSFNWSPAGGNPFTAMSPLTAEMVLYGDSLTVFRERPYDSLLVPGAGTGVQTELKIVVGWSVPNDGGGIIPANLVRAINEARTTLFCTAVGQKFDFRDDGSFNLTLSYKARISSALKSVDLLDVRSKRVKAKEAQRRIHKNLFDKFNKEAAKKITDKKYAVPLIPDLVVSGHNRFEKNVSHYENLLGASDREIAQLAIDNAKPRTGENHLLDYGKALDRSLKKINRQRTEYAKYKEAKQQWETKAGSAYEARKAATWTSLGFDEKAVDDFVRSMGGTKEQQATAKAALQEEMKKIKNPFAMKTDKHGNSIPNGDKFEGVAQDIVSNLAEQRTSTAYQRFVNILEDLHGKKGSAILNLVVTKEEVDRYFDKYGGSKTAGNFKQDVRKAAAAVLPEEKRKLLEKGKTTEKGKGPEKTPDRGPPPKPIGTVPSSIAGFSLNPFIQPEHLGAGNSIIPFFFFGDLIDAIMGLVAAPMKEERIRLVLGSMRYFNYFTKRASIVPLANIPISVRRYNAWIHDTFVKTIKKITLEEFLAKAIKSLIAPAFGSEAFSNVPPLGKDSPNRCTFSFVGGPESANKKLPPGTARAEKIVGALHNPGYAGSSMNFILVTSDMTSQGHSGGNIAVDASRGIPHIYLGANAGMIKSATFSKVTLTGYREDRMIQGSKSGLSAVREPYNVDITTIGNTIFKPGVQFFLLPTLPGSTGLEVAQQVGLGGYFTVLSTDNTLMPGKFETIVKAQFESFADGSGAAKSSRTKATVQVPKTTKNLSDDTPKDKKGRKAELVEEAAVESTTNMSVEPVADGSSKPMASMP